MMWILLILFMALLSVVGFAFVVTRIGRFRVIRDHFGKRGAFLVSFFILSMVMAGLFLWGGLMNAMIVFIHLLLIWLLCEGAFSLAARLRSRPFVRYWAGVTAIAVTACYLGMGVYFAHHVYRTDYTVDVEKDLGVERFRIVGFSDSHLGTTFRGDKLREYVSDMNRENPDIAVIVGDFVDDDTSYQDMVDGCAALGELETKYGVYFVFGNHDCGYYNSRGYGKAELVENLQKNHVTVLEDEVISLAGNVVLCGRQDTQQWNRASMEELAARCAPEDCMVVLDHEPNDYVAQAGTGADLVLSGHTHGGQFFPIIRAGEWIGANDWTYGLLDMDKTHFVVSSGIADWAFQFKTGCISEYFVVDLI